MLNKPVNVLWRRRKGKSEDLLLGRCSIVLTSLTLFASSTSPLFSAVCSTTWDVLEAVKKDDEQLLVLAPIPKRVLFSLGGNKGFLK